MRNKAMNPYRTSGYTYVGMALIGAKKQARRLRHHKIPRNPAIWRERKMKGETGREKNVISLFTLTQISLLSEL